DGNLAMGVHCLQTIYIALRVACYGQSPLGVERHPVRSGFRAAIGSRSLVSARLQKHAHTLPGRPFANAVARDLGKEQIACGNPNRSLHPIESRCESFKTGLAGDNLIEFCAKPLNFHSLSLCSGPDS